MFTVICLHTSYDLLLGCTPSWEDCHAYLLYIILMALLPSSLKLINKNGLTTICLNLPFSWHMHWNTSFFLSFSISHIFSFLLRFLFGEVYYWKSINVLLMHADRAQYGTFRRSVLYHTCVFCTYTVWCQLTDLHECWRHSWYIIIRMPEQWRHFWHISLCIVTHYDMIVHM